MTTVRIRLAAMLMALLLLWPTLGLTESPHLDTLKEQRGALTGELDVVRGEEQAVLKELFNLNRSLDQIRGQISVTEEEMAGVEQVLQVTVEQGNALRARYQARLEQFGRRVRFMAERGPITYLQVLLEAKDLSDFIWRLGLIRAFINRDATLLSDVRSLRQEVAAKEAELQAQRRQLAELNSKLLGEQGRLEDTIRLKNDRLVALQDQRGGYEQSLDALEKAWNEQAVPLLKAFGQAFHTMTLRVTELQPAQFDVVFLPVPTARVIVKTDDLNNFLEQFPDLKGLRFTLLPGKANLSGDFGGATLEFNGTFVIVGKTVLRYAPERISFAGLPIDEQYTRELVAGGGLDLDLASIVTNWKLNTAVVDTDTVTVTASYSP